MLVCAIIALSMFIVACLCVFITACIGNKEIPATSFIYSSIGLILSILGIIGICVK